MTRILNTGQIPPQMCGTELARVADKYRAVEFERIPWESLDACSNCPTLARSGAPSDGEAELTYWWGHKRIRQSCCGGCLDEVIGRVWALGETNPGVRASLIVRILLDVDATWVQA